MTAAPARLGEAEIRFAVLEGLSARHFREAARNPYGRMDRRRSGPEAVKAVAWAWGMSGAPSRAASETVSHETDAVMDDPRGPTWPPLHRAVLIHCAGYFKAGEIGRMIGRSANAVRVQRSRLRKAGAL